MAVNEAPQEQPMAAEQAAAPAGQGGGDPMKAIQDLGVSLSGLLDALSQSSAPKEVIAPLQQAVQAYTAFTEALQGKGQQQMPMADMNQAGNQNTAPANY